MLAPPDSNVAQVTIAAMKLYAPYGLYTFDRPELSHTLWEGPAGVELVVGNPTYAEQSPSFSLDRSRYPELGSGQIMALLFDSAGQQIGSLGSFDGDIGITVPVPPLDLSVVRFVAE